MGRIFILARSVAKSLAFAGLGEAYTRLRRSMVYDDVTGGYGGEVVVEPTHGNGYYRLVMRLERVLPPDPDALAVGAGAACNVEIPLPTDADGPGSSPALLSLDSVL